MVVQNHNRPMEITPPKYAHTTVPLATEKSQRQNVSRLTQYPCSKPPIHTETTKIPHNGPHTKRRSSRRPIAKATGSEFSFDNRATDYDSFNDHLGAPDTDQKINSRIIIYIAAHPTHFSRPHRSMIRLHTATHTKNTTNQR